jgi:hypothetical protein
VGVFGAVFLGPISLVALPLLAVVDLRAFGPLLFTWGGLGLLYWGYSVGSNQASPKVE